MRGGRALGRGLVTLALLAAVAAPGGLLARWPGQPLPLLMTSLAGWTLVGTLEAVLARGPAWSWGLGRQLCLALAGWALVQEGPAFLEALASTLPGPLAGLSGEGAEWARAVRSAWGGPLLAGTVLWARTGRLLPGAGPAGRPLLASVQAAGGALMAWGWLGPSGVLAAALGRDLAFLLPAGLVGLAGPPLARALPPALERGAPFLAPLLEGLLRFAALALLLVPLPRALEALAGPGAALLDTVGILARWSPLHGVGLALLLVLPGTLRGLQQRGASGLPIPLLEAVGMAAMGILSWTLLAGLGDLWPPLPRMGEAVLGGFLAGAAGQALSPLARTRHPALRALGEWAGASALRNLALGSALTAYVRFVRAPLYAAIPYAPVLEWGLVTVLALRLFLGVRSALGRALAEGAGEAAPPVWTRHRPSSAVRPDPGLEWARAAVARFVEEGDRADLTVALTDALLARGWSPAEVAEALRPLLNHRDRPEPWPAFPWERRRVREANRSARARLVARYTALLEERPTPLHKEVRP